MLANVCDIILQAAGGEFYFPLLADDEIKQC